MTTEHPSLSHQQPTMEHAIVAIWARLDAAERARADGASDPACTGGYEVEE